MNKGVDESNIFKALEYIEEEEVNLPKALNKGQKKKKNGSPNGGGGKAKNSVVK